MRDTINELVAHLAPTEATPPLRDIEQRAATLRRRRSTSAGMIVAVALALGAGLVAVWPQAPSSTDVAVEGPPTPPVAGELIDGVFVPPHQTEDGRTTATMSTPTGTRFAFSYPEPLAFQALGLEMAGAFDWEVRAPDDPDDPDACCSRALSVRPNELSPDVFARADEAYDLRGGATGAWFAVAPAEVNPRGAFRGSLLVLVLDPWIVLVPDLPAGDPMAMTAEERQFLVEHLSLRLNDEQVVVVEAAAPVRLADVLGPDATLGQGAVGLTTTTCRGVGEVIYERDDATAFLTETGIRMCFPAAGVELALDSTGEHAVDVADLGAIDVQRQN